MINKYEAFGLLNEFFSSAPRNVFFEGWGGCTQVTKMYGLPIRMEDM